jgi:hypothetical protein
LSLLSAALRRYAVGGQRIYVVRQAATIQVTWRDEPGRERRLNVT